MNKPLLLVERRALEQRALLINEGSEYTRIKARLAEIEKSLSVQTTLAGD